MSAPLEPIAYAHDMATLVGALKARRYALGLSQIAVDEIAGIQTGYTAKVECRSKNPGPMSLGALLGALGIQIAIIRSAASQSGSASTSTDYSVIAKKHREKIGAKGGRTRVRNQTAEQRRASARHAAKSRWRDWRQMKAEKERKAKRAEKQSGQVTSQ